MSQYGLTHTVLSRILHKFQPKAHIFFGVKMLIKKMYQGQYGLTHIVLSRILYKFPLKACYKAPGDLQVKIVRTQ